MSREQLFDLLWTVVPVALICQTALAGAAFFWWINSEERATEPPLPVSPQTNDLAPVFRCIGAGGQVVVSRGGDGSSIYIFCDEVKS